MYIMTPYKNISRSALIFNINFILLIISTVLILYDSFFVFVSSAQIEDTLLLAEHTCQKIDTLLIQKHSRYHFIN